MPRYCPTCDRVIAQDRGRCPEDGTVLVEIGAGDDPFVGRKLAGLYTLKERIGACGMGAVYRAWQHSIGRDVAGKIIHPRIGHESRAPQRALRQLPLPSRPSPP